MKLSCLTVLYSPCKPLEQTANNNVLLVNTGQKTWRQKHGFCFSLPNEVCTVISDADCITPMETVCNAATPSPDCQLILRQFFNDSGVFCINVSLTNDVSLAVASARVSVTVGGWKLNRLETREVSQYSTDSFVIRLMCLSFSVHWHTCWNCSHSYGCYGHCMCCLFDWFDVQVSPRFPFNSAMFRFHFTQPSAGVRMLFDPPLRHSEMIFAIVAWAEHSFIHAYCLQTGDSNSTSL